MWWQSDRRRCCHVRLSARDRAHGPCRGMPVGLSVMDAKWNDADLRKAGYVFEQAMKMRAGQS